MNFKKCLKIWSLNLRGRDHMEKEVVDGRTLQWILRNRVDVDLINLFIKTTSVWFL